jgi:hypothetical protein
LLGAGCSVGVWAIQTVALGNGCAIARVQNQKTEAIARPRPRRKGFKQDDFIRLF